MLAPFTAHYVVLVDDIVDERVGIHSMTFKESYEQDYIDGNDE